MAAGPFPAVRKLAVHRFRNYVDAALEVNAPAVVLTGPNGAGKTNLLEALSFLAPGRGRAAATLVRDSFPGVPCRGRAAAQLRAGPSTPLHQN